jgi:hypothetical protein
MLQGKYPLCSIAYTLNSWAYSISGACMIKLNENKIKLPDATIKDFKT